MCTGDFLSVGEFDLDLDVGVLFLDADVAISKAISKDVAISMAISLKV